MGARARDVSSPAGEFDELTVVLSLMDLAGFTRAVGDLSARGIAELLDRFYRLASGRVSQHGGRVVKFSGDNCLALFEPADAPRAVQCVVDVRDDVSALADELGLELELGGNVHLATVAVGMFGDPATASFDVAGLGVIHTYRLGAGAGIRLSEPVYRRLPSSDRSVWRRYQPPTTYRFAP